MKILLVEDEKKIADLIKKGMEEENYEIDIEANGKEGLEKALTNGYSLIILDIMLPDIDGISICKSLRDNNIETPILFLSAKNEVKDKVLGLDSGANDYLTKPFAFEELLARVRALLRRNSNINTKLQVADLEMDLLARKVVRNGKEISLTLKEFLLLECLMKNQNSIVSRDMIKEKIKNFEEKEITTNVIDVYINYLRKKIDKNFDKKLIFTVRGSGYMIKS